MLGILYWHRRKTEDRRYDQARQNFFTVYDVPIQLNSDGHLKFSEGPVTHELIKMHIMKSLRSYLKNKHHGFTRMMVTYMREYAGEYSARVILWD